MSVRSIDLEAIPTRPLTSLAPNSPVVVREVVASPVKTVAVVEETSSSSGSCSSALAIFLVFLVVTIITFFLLYALNPTNVQNTNANGQPDGTPSAGKCVVGAIIWGIIFALIFWAFVSVTSW